jgi:predicted enzyme related to lactoylglutathione lyase
MSERERYEPGVPCWVETLQPDPEAALGFYAGLFGWEFPEAGPMPGDPPGRYYVARVRGRDVAGIGSRPAGAPASPTWTMHVSVASADDAAVAVRAAGGAVLAEPFDVAPAGRVAVLADPAGAPFCAWEPGARAGAQLVNEAWAWAISNLAAPNPDAAAAFYGAVFGWTTEAFGDLTMFRLPGYVGGEPAQPVSREVIAVMRPAEDGEAPGWAADFWVGDADEAAASAVRLGGTVVAGPFETPTGNTAVLADPAGVVFTASTAPGPPSEAAA